MERETVCGTSELLNGEKLKFETDLSQNAYPRKIVKEILCENSQFINSLRNAKESSRRKVKG